MKIKKLKLIFSCIAICSIVLACSSNSSKDAIKQARFDTRISSSGLKHFELRPPLGKQNPESRGAPPQPANRIDSRKSLSRQIKSLKKLASKIIEENQYCKKGFWILDADIDPRGIYLRGECNDLASDVDKTAFPDTIDNW